MSLYTITKKYYIFRMGDDIFDIDIVARHLTLTQAELKIKELKKTDPYSIYTLQKQL
jgi:hypothetical protein